MPEAYPLLESSGGPLFCYGIQLAVIFEDRDDFTHGVLDEIREFLAAPVICELVIFGHQDIETPGNITWRSGAV